MLQCILSNFPASVHEFYTNILVFVNINPFFILTTNLNCSLLASEYLNSKQVSTMYFLICCGHCISKIALRDTYWKKGGVFSTKTQILVLKTPPFFQYVSRIEKKGGSLIVKLKFTIKDPPKTPIREFSPYNLTSFWLYFKRIWVWSYKIHILWEGFKILRNLHLTFDCT